MAVSRRPRTAAEARCDEILAEIPDADLDALAACLANVLISAARSDRRWRTLSRSTDGAAGGGADERPAS